MCSRSNVWAGVGADAVLCSDLLVDFILQLLRNIHKKCVLSLNGTLAMSAQLVCAPLDVRLHVR